MPSTLASGVPSRASSSSMAGRMRCDAALSTHSRIVVACFPSNSATESHRVDVSSARIFIRPFYRRHDWTGAYNPRLSP
jgi:hypothetical protein